ncbi:transglutaminase-like domain-containing protein, partial [Arthrospira platensis SPKY1]|nr:transglutaminase-like domain-containing protein [Arthrospira platensis SPKY1]
SVLFFQMNGIRAVDRLPANGEDLHTLGARHPLLSLPADPEEVDYLRAFLARHHLFPVGQEHANQSIAGLGHALVELLADRGYSLETRLPQGSGSPLVRWLQSELPGHCEFFAGAMVLLARAADIPARVVVGFHGGDWNT